ncbi:MAG: bestrophin family protein [Cytophagales bacterium]|nr:bestrophin family protein [Cytophagales bacterium]
MADHFDIHAMEDKKPSMWFSVVFDYFRTPTLRKTTFSALLVGVYVLIINYLEKFVVHVDFHPPSTIFYILGSVLGWLLVFRTYTAYDRWWKGRIAISYLSNNAKNFSSKMNAYLDKSDIENRKFFANMIANHAYAMKEMLRHGIKYSELIETKPGELSEIKKTYHVPNEIAAQLMIRLTLLYKTKIISYPQYLEAHTYIDTMNLVVADCERIHSSPIPFAYRIHLKKYVLLFAIIMPYGFIDYLDYWSTLVIAVIFYAMYGLDLLAEEIEDPFGDDENDLPIDYVCASIEKYSTTNLQVSIRPSHKIHAHEH